LNILIAPALGVFGLIAAFVVFSLVMRYSDGTDQVKKIGDEIHKGAMKFMKTEYTYLLIFVAVLVVLVATFLTIQSAIAVIVGAACSSLAGFIGMYAATKANVRTATAAQQDGAAAALSVSFYGGSVMGLCVASLGLIGLGGLFYFFSESHVHALEGFGMGAQQTGIVPMKYTNLVRDSQYLMETKKVAELICNEEPELANQLIERWISGSIAFADA